MGLYDFSPSELISARERFAPPKSLVPPVDKAVSAIVGVTVYQRDPRLLNLIMKFKKAKSNDEPDNFLENPKFIEELKRIFLGV